MTETVPRAPEYWLAADIDVHPSRLMKIDDNNSTCFGLPTTREQQNISTNQYASAERSELEIGTRQTDPGSANTFAYSQKKVTWKNPIVDKPSKPPIDTENKTEDAFNTVQSKYNKTFKGRMRPNPCIRHHPAYETLFEYATEGCPVDCGESWSQEQLEEAIHRGNHASA